MRLVKQVAEFVGRLAGFNQRGDYDAAIDAADQLWDKLFDVPRELRDTIDTPTLAGLLREPAAMRAAAQIFVEEGRALAGKGDPPGARMRYRRAIELHLEARALEPSEVNDRVLLELSRTVPVQDLDPRYRGMSKPGEPGDQR